MAASSSATSARDLFSESDDSDPDYSCSEDYSSDSSEEVSVDSANDETSSDDEPLAAKVRRLHAQNRPSGGSASARAAAARAAKKRWKDGPFSPKLFTFTMSDVETGINGQLNLSNESTEFEIFKLFFDSDVMEHIVLETNKYHVFLKSQTNLKDKSKLHRWVDVTEDELYTFLGVVMLMSLQKKQKMTDYWSTDPLISTPMFGKILSCDRFHLILRALHFNDNETQTPDDKLFKIRPIIDMLKLNYGKVFYPSQNLAIDESLMLWKGRLSFKQFIPSKRHRFGIKLFVLCDCLTGYVIDFIVYTGATTEIGPVDGDMGISGAIVMTLMDRFLKKGHVLYTDNWYTSPALAEKLHEEKTGICGTVKCRRKGMPDFPDKLKKGDLVEKHYQNMLALKWHDRRDVHMLSTVNEPGQSPSGKKNRTTQEDIMKPTCVVEYNQNMGPIDKCDMQLSFVECIRKSSKWYKKFFFHLLDISVLNAFVVFKATHTVKRLEFSDFQLELIRQILQQTHQARKSPKGGRKSKSENPLRLTERHFPSLVPPTPKKATPQRQCHVCAHTTLGPITRKDSRYMCKDCDLGLCPVPCFEIFHTKLTF